MDLDAYVASRGRHWGRLEELVSRRRLTGAEADELLDLYQQVSTDLSVVRSASPDPSVVTHLSMLLTRARLVTSGTRTSTWGSVLRFLTHTFPGALWRMRWWWGATSVLSVLVAFAVGAYAVRHPEVWTSQMSPAEIEAYVGTDFENYYSEFPHHEFATLVWLNNAWVAAQCIAFGVLGLPTLFVLVSNVANVGIAGALMAANDRASLFFGLILPHGLLELTAVFIAAAVGLRLFWSWVVPGPRTRLQSLATEGRASVGVAIGLALVLFVSGGVEGFVTPSGLPTAARIAIGVVVELAFLTYVVVLGRRAVAEGVTGDLDRREVGDSAPVVG